MCVSVFVEIGVYMYVCGGILVHVIYVCVCGCLSWRAILKKIQTLCDKKSSCIQGLPVNGGVFDADVYES